MKTITTVGYRSRNTSHGGMRQRGGVAVAVAVLVALASCGSTTSAGLPSTAGAAPTSPSSSALPGSSSESPDPSTSTSSTAAEPDRGPEWPESVHRSGRGLAGLDTWTVSDNAAQIHIVVPQLDGYDVLNEQLKTWSEDRADTYRADDVNDEGMAAGTAWISGSWAVAGAAADMIGFTTMVSYSPGASTASEQRTIWFDIAAEAAIPWPDFLAESARSQLPDRIAAALADTLSQQSAADAVPTVPVDDVAAAIDDGRVSGGFSEGGELVLTFDSYTVLAGSFGNPSVALTVDATDLTDAGQRAQRAATAIDNAAVPAASELPGNPGRGPEETHPTMPSQPADDEADCTVDKCVALTFDDGPSGSTTPRLLDILADENVPVTFFILGSQADSFPDIVKAEQDAGHEIASHTWSHPSLPGLGGKQLASEIDDTNRVLTDITGMTPTLLRPPYGATDDTVAAAAADAGMAQILWNIDTRDWDHHDPAQTIAAASAAEAGSIILMHDIHATTIDAVPGVIETLREQGFTFVTVSQLLGHTTPGERYFSG